MKLSKKIMILSLFLVIICCIGSASATEDVNDDNITELNDIETTVDNTEINNNLDSSNEILSNSMEDTVADDVDEIYVNGSKDYYAGGDGKSLDTAYGGYDDGLWDAIDEIEPNGIIYLTECDTGYFDFGNIEKDKNFTIMGLNNNVIIKSLTISKANNNVNSVYTFKNIIFDKLNNQDRFKYTILERNSIFINCTFLTPIKYGEKNSNYLSQITSFYNCTFKNYISEEEYNKFYQDSVLELDNCIFKDITSDSLFKYEGNSYNGNSAINITNSNFVNVTTNGVVDIFNENAVIFENNIGDVNLYRSTPEDSKITISATKEALTITLKDSEGNIIKNAPITITAPSHDPNFHREVTTNDEGIAVFNMAGSDWTVWCAEYDGIKSRTFSAGPAEASVNLKTLAKGLNVQFTNVTDVTGKTMLVVTVKNNLSEIVSNTNFTFTLNGKDYNATTDANGQFIASGLTGDVSVGVKYNGTEYDALDANSNFTFPKTESEDNTPSGNTTPTNTTPSDDKKPSQPGTPAKKVTPVATKITAKKATFKAKKKAKKYSITLKAGKKAVAKVKVTIKVGKKTYKATTNKKGKAIFNLKKLTKKGKYTAVIKFKGNKNYKATSKKVKIVVK